MIEKSLLSVIPFSERKTEIVPSSSVITMDVYRSVREKQGNVVYRQRVLQTVTSLRVVSLVFRGHDLLKFAKININPQQEATLSVWKKLVPRESAGNGAQVLVNT